MSDLQRETQCVETTSPAASSRRGRYEAAGGHQPQLVQQVGESSAGGRKEGRRRRTASSATCAPSRHSPHLSAAERARCAAGAISATCYRASAATRELYAREGLDATREPTSYMRDAPHTRTTAYGRRTLRGDVIKYESAITPDSNEERAGDSTKHTTIPASAAAECDGPTNGNANALCTI